jgi:hypothetical protein
MFVTTIKKRIAFNEHFIGIILFFILHGYVRNYPLVPVSGLMVLLLQLLASGFLLYWLCKKFFSSSRKAGLFTSFCLIIVLFFGPLQELFALYRFSATFARLVYFFPFCIILFLATGIWLKRSNRTFERAPVFINTVIIVYLLVECGNFIGLVLFPAHSSENSLNKKRISLCDTCKKPPVYLVLLDEHISPEGEQKYLDYYDSSFARFLQHENFYLVQHPQSNYFLTIYSMASILNMKYHENMGPLEIKNHFAYSRAQKEIRDNAVCDFFDKLGYRIVNYSGFNLRKAPAGYASELPSAIQLITNQTMFHLVGKSLPMELAGVFKFSWLSRRLKDEYINNNEAMMAHTLADAQKNNAQPAFTYVHLMMPHAPFAFDSTGRHTYQAQINKENYLQYLVYTDKRITRFIKELKRATKGQAVILVMGDHGVRLMIKNSALPAFQALNAIYLPEKKYAAWYPGITHVNQFRVLFNTLFRQHLPLLPDSLVTR